MPKNKPPKYSKIGKYAVVYIPNSKKPHYLGLYNSPEAKAAYARFEAEWWANFRSGGSPNFLLSKGDKSVTVKELATAFLDHAEANVDPTSYTTFRIIVLDFLIKFYGDNMPADDFKPSCLKLLREKMVQSKRFNRNTVNRHTTRFVSIFAWGVENEMVPETTWRTLKAVKALPKGYVGTFEGKGREEVPYSVIEATLPFLPPMLRAMVLLQYIYGFRPGEVFQMRCGEIDTTRGNGLWYYTPGSYKTEEHVGKMEFPIGKAGQELLAPYLVGKNSEQAVFPPSTAQEERKAEKRANRNVKITPSQAARDKARVTKPSRRYTEFYDRHSYNHAIEYAINKGNKTLPDGAKIQKWTPYQLRNSAATEIELEIGLDEAQAQLGHKSANMTRRYSKAQLKIRENLARNRRNPFDSDGQEKEVA